MPGRGVRKNRDMQFLSDVFIRCPDCDGRRYREHILAVKIRSGEQESATSVPSVSARRRKPPTAAREWSIADLLEATVEEAVEFLSGFTDSQPARRAVVRLRLLAEVGLGYLRLGQPINTLSGGESQRLKLVRHLAEAETMGPSKVRSAQGVRKTKAGQAGAASQRTPDIAPTLFLFDEPTTGLHFEDVSILLKVFQRLVDAGHSVLVIEHNLEVIKCADWVMDLGPEAGAGGGRLVAQGTPQDLAACSSSHTGQALRSLLG